MLFSAVPCKLFTQLISQYLRPIAFWRTSSLSITPMTQHKDGIDERKSFCSHRLHVLVGVFLWLSLDEKILPAPFSLFLLFLVFVMHP